MPLCQYVISRIVLLSLLVVTLSTTTVAFVNRPIINNKKTTPLARQIEILSGVGCAAHHHVGSSSTCSISNTLSRRRCQSSVILTATKEPSSTSFDTEKAISAISSNPTRSILFSIIISLCGASLGPFLDSYHSLFGVLTYDEPIYFTLWGTPESPALVTAWWVPELFGSAGFIIGWLYIILDAALQTPTNNRAPSPPKILTGISFFTFQYWLSGILFASGTIDRSSILDIMSALCILGFIGFDRTKSGFITSLATAVGGPLIEVGLITFLVGHGGYHYNDLGETGFFPLWIVPVYFLGGPAVGNLSRGIWNRLSQSELEDTKGEAPATTGDSSDRPRCKVCNDTRAVGCPNCDAQGYYVTYGKEVKCPACKGRGLVICRSCFASYGDDPNDIENIREMMSRIPD